MHRFLGWLDRWQKRHRVVAFPHAVHKRFGEDRGPHYSALFAYYGFLSIFPLLLALVSVLGIVLRNHPKARDEIIESALQNVPVVGGDLKTLSGSVWAVVFGVIVALWSGLGAVYAMQHAMDTMWAVPESKRPNFLVKRLRGLAMLGVLGGGILAATTVSAFATGLGLARSGQVLTWLGTIVIDIGTLGIAFDLLSRERLGWHTVYRGAIAGGLGLFALQLLGNWYVQRVLNDASPTYGAFAAVIGLMTWFSVMGRIVLYAAEVNVVLAKRLWPRSLKRSFDTEIDRRALADQAARWQ